MVRIQIKQTCTNKVNNINRDIVVLVESSSVAGIPVIPSFSSQCIFYRNSGFLIAAKEYEKARRIQAKIVNFDPSKLKQYYLQTVNKTGTSPATANWQWILTSGNKLCFENCMGKVEHSMQTRVFCISSGSRSAYRMQILPNTK